MGKSYIAIALAHKACREGYSARYLRLPRLLQALHIARGDGSYPKFLKQLARFDVLVIDDWGVAPLDDVAQRDLLEILDDRFNLRSTIDHQPAARFTLAPIPWRCDAGRRHTRPLGTQRLQDRNEGRIHAQKAQPVDPETDPGVKRNHPVRTGDPGGGRFGPEWVAGILRNRWPIYVGMPGNNPSEQVSTFIGIPSPEAGAPIIESEQLA